MSESKKEIQEKEKTYHGKTKSKRPIYITAVILLIYIFFFTSKLTVPQPITKADNVTIPGTEEEFAQNRSVTLLSAEYSKDQEMLEMVLNLKNENYDNVNDYYYALTAVNENSADIEIKEVIKEDLLAVIRLQGVKKNYREIEFMIAPKLGPINEISDDMTASIILNKYNVTTVSKIDTAKTKTEYLQERLIGMTQQLESKLDKQEYKLEQLETKKAALQKEIEDSEKEEKYMTAAEAKSTALRNAENQELILDTEDLIQKQKEKITKTKAEIEDAQSKIKALKGK